VNIGVLHRQVVRDIEQIIDIVDAAFPVTMPARYNERDFSVPAFVKKLNKVLEPFHIHNQIMPDPEMPKGQLATAGLWVSEDELPLDGSYADVRVIWHTHPNGMNVDMTPQKWMRRRYVFWARIFHELVHRYQDRETATRVFRARGVESPEDIEEQEYHGNFDEIEAYAAEAALESLAWWPDLTLSAAKAASMDYEGKLLPTYKCYMLMFDKGHPAIGHFQRKLTAWYKEMQRQPDFYARLMLPKLA
jgi:hypothetical protein